MKSSYKSGIKLCKRKTESRIIQKCSENVKWPVLVFFTTLLQKIVLDEHIKPIKHQNKPLFIKKAYLLCLAFIQDFQAPKTLKWSINHWFNVLIKQVIQKILFCNFAVILFKWIVFNSSLDYFVEEKKKINIIASGYLRLRLNMRKIKILWMKWEIKQANISFTFQKGNLFRCLFVQFRFLSKEK